jgi:hypothetical protein
MEINKSKRIMQMLITRDTADYLMLHDAFGKNTETIHQNCCYHMLVYLNNNITQIVHYHAFDDIDDAKSLYSLSFEKLLIEVGVINRGIISLMCSYYGLVDTYRLMKALKLPSPSNNSAFLNAISGYSNGFLVYKYQFVLLYRNITKCSLKEAEDFVRDWNKKMSYTRKIACEIIFENNTLYDLLVSKRLFADFEFYIDPKDEFLIRLQHFVGL